MKLNRSLAAFAMAAGLVCASGITAAATAPAAAASNEVAALKTCPQQASHARTYYNGCASWTSYICTAGHKFNISPPDYFSNDCVDTVQLWTGSNETGVAICIPHYHASNLLSTQYHSFDITSKTAC
jgi:hypothetical protein